MTQVRFGGRTERCARPRPGAVVLLALGASAGGCGEDRGPRRHEIAIRDFEYHPAALTVAVGDTVLWINGDVVPHTATAADRAFGTGTLERGDTGRVVISGKADGSYVCAFHPTMKGKLTMR